MSNKKIKVPRTREEAAIVINEFISKYKIENPSLFERSSNRCTLDDYVMFINLLSLHGFKKIVPNPNYDPKDDKSVDYIAKDIDKSSLFGTYGKLILKLSDKTDEVMINQIDWIRVNVLENGFVLVEFSFPAISYENIVLDSELDHVTRTLYAGPLLPFFVMETTFNMCIAPILSMDTPNQGQFANYFSKDEDTWDTLINLCAPADEYKDMIRLYLNWFCEPDEPPEFVTVDDDPDNGIDDSIFFSE